MEIHDKPVQDPRPVRPSTDALIDFTRPLREGIRKFQENFEPTPIEVPDHSERKTDRVELSEQARALAAEESESDVRARLQREARLADLRLRYENGTLNTPERVVRTAEQLLGAE